MQGLGDRDGFGLLEITGDQDVCELYISSEFFVFLEVSAL